MAISKTCGNENRSFSIQRFQAACKIGKASRVGAWASFKMAVAISRQLPQLLPRPVRIVSSATSRTPSAAARWIALSVIPKQTQTYMADSGPATNKNDSYLTLNENDCQQIKPNGYRLPNLGPLAAANICWTSSPALVGTASSPAIVRA